MTGSLKARWTAMTARERGLIVLASVVALALAGVQFGLVPLAAKRDQARAAYAEAAVVLAEVRDGAARLETLGASGEGPEPGALRAVLTASATQRGLAITRVQPLDDDALSVRFDSAEPASLYAWLTSLTETTGARVRQATVRRDGGSADAVQATFVLEGGAS